MPSVNEEFIYLRKRLDVFEKACLKAVGELATPNPQVGPALMHVQGAIMTNDRLVKEYNMLNCKKG